MLAAESIEADLLVNKMAQLRMHRSRLAAIRHDGLPFYKPFEKQDAFHRAGRYKRRMVRAGNRFGKSLMGCAEDCAWLRGERPWYAKGTAERGEGIPQSRPNRGLVITTDWDVVDQVWTSQRGDEGKIWKFLPRDGFVKSSPRNHMGVISTIEGANGSILRFDTVRSWMANPQSSESIDWDFIHVDEPCPEGMFKAAARGLIDRGGSAWFTLTPLREFWINDYFFPQDTGGRPRDNVWALTGSTYDNITLSRDDIKDFEDTLSEDEKQCRLHGIPLHLSGLIYKQFSWDRHVLKDLPKDWDSFDNPPRDLPVYFAIDPHPQTPHAVLFLVVLPSGKRVYFRDIFLHCSVEELSQQIRVVLGGRNVVRGKIDPLAYINDPITETNMAEEFARHGLFLDKATKALAQGILRVQGELKRDSILFTPTCRRTLWEIQRYAWDAKENKPVDKDDHAMECLYRLELDDPIFVDAAKQSGPAIDEIQITRSEIETRDLEFTL